MRSREAKRIHHLDSNQSSKIIARAADVFERQSSFVAKKWLSNAIAPSSRDQGAALG